MAESVKKKSSLLSVLGIVCFVILCLFCLCLFGTFLLLKGGIRVKGASMLPSLEDGDYLYVEFRQNPQRGDIVIIEIPQDLKDRFSGEFIVKRVIATEGDEIYCEDATVYVRYAGEGEFIPYPETGELASPTPDFSAVTIGEGEIWCMGDNRSVSLDSTEVGAFETKDLYGIVPKWAEKSKDFLSGVYKVILFIRGENI